MGFERKNARDRLHRAEGNTQAQTTPPDRSEVGRPFGTELGHVQAILPQAMDARTVPVRRLKRSNTNPWDGVLEYATEEPDDVLCLPPLRARHYEALVYKGNDPNALFPVVKIFYWKGAWVADHPQIQMLSSEQLTEIQQNFVVSDCAPNPLLESTS